MQTRIAGLSLLPLLVPGLVAQLGPPAAPGSRPSSAASASPRRPPPLREAFTAMNARHSCGIAIAIPADAVERERLARWLNEWLLEPYLGPAAALFLRAVLVCVPAAELPLRPDEDAVVFDET